ncbi:MAG: hypothetical protein ACLFVU_12560, partial [Phycisphaerae bacterium]
MVEPAVSTRRDSQLPTQVRVVRAVRGYYPQIRNPNPEIRNKCEFRNVKAQNSASETQFAWFALFVADNRISAGSPSKTSVLCAPRRSPSILSPLPGLFIFSGPS